MIILTPSFYKNLTKTIKIVTFTIAFCSNHLLARNDLVEIEPDTLYTGHGISPKGVPIFYGFEKVDHSNITFWKNYTEKSRKLVDYCLDLWRDARGLENLQTRENIQKMFGLSSQEHNKIINHFKNAPAAKGLMFSENGIRCGICGMEWALYTFPSNDQRSYYVSYASSAPVTKRFQNFNTRSWDNTKSDLENKTAEIEEFKKHYGSLLMSVVATTAPKIPTVTHYGIFGNVLEFLDPDGNFRGISMPLHGYSAAVERAFFEGKEYMITWPTESMTDIMLQKIPAENIHLGTNEDLASAWPKDIELCTKYPPLLHHDANTNLTKIAKKGVDLKQYPHSLPNHLASFSQTPGKEFDFSYPTGGSLKTLVDLHALAKFYNPTPTIIRAPVAPKKPDVPVKKAPVPVKKEAAPRRKAVAPVKKAAAPIKKAVAPIKKAVAPVKKAVAPIKKAVPPIKKAVAPVKKAVAPVKKAAAPIKKAVAPIKKAVAPVKKAVVPAKKPSVLPKKPAAPVKKAPVLPKKSAVPLKKAPAAKKTTIPVKKTPRLIKKAVLPPIKK